MASKSKILLTAHRSFKIIRLFQQGFKPLQWRSSRNDSFKQNVRGIITSARQGSQRSRQFSSFGSLTIGTSMALLGFTKEEKLSEYDQVRSLVTQAINAKKSKEVKLATTKFHAALDLSTDFFHENKISENEYLNQKVFIYDQMANLSLEVGNLKQAEQLFKETMRLAIKLGMKENDNAIVEMSMKLAIIYMYTGRPKLAHQGFNFCISEQEKKLSDEVDATVTDNTEVDKTPTTTPQERSTKQDTQIILGKAYQHYSHTFMQSRDFKNALVYSEKALDISKETLGATNENTFVLINDMATCQIMLQLYDDAERSLKDAIKSSRRSNNAIESALCSNLGALYIRMNRLDEAESTCKRGLKVAEKHYDSYLMGPCQMCLKKLDEVRRGYIDEEDETVEEK